MVDHVSWSDHGQAWNCKSCNELIIDRFSLVSFDSKIHFVKFVSYFTERLDIWLIRLLTMFHCQLMVNAWCWELLHQSEVLPLIIRNSMNGKFPCWFLVLKCGFTSSNGWPCFMVWPWSTHHGQETNEMIVDHGQTMIDHGWPWSHGQTAARVANHGWTMVDLGWPW